MSMDSVIDLGKVCGRKLSEAETARLRETGNKLNLREDDALWPLLAAMEYQRIYYEALPEKIAGSVQSHHGRHGRCRRKRDCRSPSPTHRQRGEGGAKPCLKDSIRQAGADVAACPDLPACLREPDALGGLSYRHRTGYASGGNPAHALRLAYQRAVSRGRSVLRGFDRKGVR